MANLPENRTLETVPSDHLADHIELHKRHNLYDAKGDLIVGQTADEAVRVPVGADGQVLTADSAVLSGGVKWAAPAQSGHVIQDEGVDLATRARLNFVGPGVAVTDDATNGQTKVTVGAGGHAIQDEGVAVTSRPTLDFVGTGVTVTDDATNAKTIITVPGGTTGAGTVRLVSAAATAANGEIILADATTAAFAVTLPTATSGHTVRVKKIDSSANAVTVDGAGADVIDNEATFVLANQYDAIQVVADGTKWWVV